METNDNSEVISTHKWYVVNTVIGQERKIAKVINEARDKNEQLAEFISDVIIPSERMTEMKHGKKVDVEKKVCPGYILLRMEMNEKTLSLIRGIKGVAKFLGRDRKPIAIPEKEVKRMMDCLTEINVLNTSASSACTYSPGDLIEIKEGAFEGFTACVDMVDNEKMRLTVSVSIFGRETPVELDFKQATKLQND